MTRDEIVGLIRKQAVATVPSLDAAKVDFSRSLRDQGASSLDVVELVSALMRQLRVKVPDPIGENLHLGWAGRLVRQRTRRKHEVGSALTGERQPRACAIAPLPDGSIALEGSRNRKGVNPLPFRTGNRPKERRIPIHRWADFRRCTAPVFGRVGDNARVFPVQSRNTSISELSLSPRATLRQ